MTVSRREGPFVAEITGDLLSARRYVAEDDAVNGAVFLTRALSEPLFVLPVSERPWFVMHGDGLYAQNARDALAPLYRGGDAAQLLRCITDLLTTVESQRIRSRRYRKYAFAAACLAGVWLTAALILSGQFPSSDSRLLTTVNSRPVFHPEAGAARYAPAVPDAPP